ncbi:4Fe-4S binding protein [Alkaliphilus hydrothermalis]|uniref:Fe-S-cluster-containing hydrogenase component 2 n=1 Tax=Alkaliphilus hydrothermalis TaxID=1482730 RepID=A0ABS2NLD8_9FIRM|nr:4Fe-4S binding protein [Alkaliphilus hydrothermalis]MBM7613744.1 Fe-S-cluster-containing hydrogenase component 2 [Alkaliphilus hydrothermalis]
MLEVTGIPTVEDIEKVFPSKERLKIGPVVVMECFQNIPCNPCYTACKTGAIKEFEDINDLPTVDQSLCNGCGLCISNCPGLSIMVVDMTYSEEEALIKIPYEFLPLPEIGETVKGLDREGKVVCEVKVVKVLRGKSLDKTPIISLAVDKEYVKIVRNIRLGE